jgi:hypothetical protein
LFAGLTDVTTHRSLRNRHPSASNAQQAFAGKSASNSTARSSITSKIKLNNLAAATSSSLHEREPTMTENPKGQILGKLAESRQLLKEAASYEISVAVLRADIEHLEAELLSLMGDGPQAKNGRTRPQVLQKNRGHFGGWNARGRRLDRQAGRTDDPP